jgi:hypothetical protein
MQIAVMTESNHGRKEVFNLGGVLRSRGFGFSEVIGFTPLP